MQRCQKCIIPANFPNANIDTQGVCSFCRGESKFGVNNDPQTVKLMADKESLKDELEQDLTNLRGTGKSYDCLVPISGGKDSTYLLWLLTHKYKLKSTARWIPCMWIL